MEGPHQYTFFPESALSVWVFHLGSSGEGECKPKMKLHGDSSIRSHLSSQFNVMAEMPPNVGVVIRNFDGLILLGSVNKKKCMGGVL